MFLLHLLKVNKPMEKTLKFLKENIVNGMSLDDIINTFEKMYEMPIKNVSAEYDLI